MTFGPVPVSYTHLDVYKRQAVDYNHAVLSWAITDINMQKTLNKYLMKEGLTQNDIVMDPTTCALGYGIEFSIDVITLSLIHI